MLRFLTVLTMVCGAAAPPLAGCGDDSSTTDDGATDEGGADEAGATDEGGADEAGADADDDSIGPCTELLCESGSSNCCLGAAPGTWNPAGRWCVCPSSGTDADADDDADADADDDVDAGVDADVTVDGGVDAATDGDVVEAVDADWPGAILCGSVVCSGGGEFCCVLEAPPVTQACVTETPPGDECAGGFEVRCDGPEDCGPVATGGNCCVSYCLRSACPPGQTACHGDTDCPSGQFCCPATMHGYTFKACGATTCP